MSQASIKTADGAFDLAHDLMGARPYRSSSISRQRARAGSSRRSLRRARSCGPRRRKCRIAINCENPQLCAMQQQLILQDGLRRYFTRTWELSAVDQTSRFHVDGVHNETSRCSVGVLMA